MSKLLKLNLQLFDGGAAAASGGDGASAEGALATQNNNGDVNLQDEFDGLVGDGGKYKAEFDSRVKSAIDKRVKNLKGYESQLKSYEPVLQMLSERYNVDPRDAQGIANALLEDQSYLEDEAIEQGLTVEQLRDFKRLQMQNRMLMQREAEANAAQDYNRWLQEAEEIKQTLNPEFDLDTEAENPQFRQIMQLPGMSLRNAYMAVHGEDLMQVGMRYATQKAKQNAVNDIKARGARPQENGSSSVGAVQTNVDISKLSSAQVKKISNLILQGEKITPENIAKYI